MAGNVDPVWGHKEMVKSVEVDSLQMGFAATKNKNKDYD